MYPIVYFDALVVKVKESHQVRNKAADIAVGVDTDGIKHVLGVQITEGATCWAGVLAPQPWRGRCADRLLRRGDRLARRRSRRHGRRVWCRPAWCV